MRMVFPQIYFLIFFIHSVSFWQPLFLEATRGLSSPLIPLAILVIFWQIPLVAIFEFKLLTKFSWLEESGVEILVHCVSFASTMDINRNERFIQRNSGKWDQKDSIIYQMEKPHSFSKS